MAQSAFARRFPSRRVGRQAVTRRVDDFPRAAAHEFVFSEAVVEAPGPAGWLVRTYGTGMAARQDTTEKLYGDSSVRLESLGTAGAAAWADAITSGPSIVGKRYRASGAYRTSFDPGAAPSLVLEVGTDDPDEFLDAGGRDHSSSSQVVLAPRALTWRRFCFDFLAFTDVTVLRLRLVCPAGEAAVAWLDGVKLQRIWRTNTYQPRLESTSIPETESARASIFFGRTTVGLGDLTLINDAELQTALARTTLLGRPVQELVGGAFSDGQQLTKDDMRVAFTGNIDEPEVDDEHISLRMQDARNFLHTKLPVEVYDRDRFPNVDPRYVDKARRLLFGETSINRANLASQSQPGDPLTWISEVYPIRYDKDPLTGYGLYEIYDNHPGGGGTSNPLLMAPNTDQRVTAYPSAEDRNKSVGQHSYALEPGIDYEWLSETRFRILRDQQMPGYRFGDQEFAMKRPYLSFDFDIGGGALVARIHTDLGLARTCATLAAAMTAAAGVTITVTYSETTHFVTTARQGGGTFNIRTRTGANRDRSGWFQLGYNADVNDYTGSSSYTTSTEMFGFNGEVSADVKHHLVWTGYGYRDDSLGTYTDTPNALIVKAADVARVLFVSELRVNPALIGASFKRARNDAFGAVSLLMLLHEQEPAKDVLEGLEQGALGDIVIDGDGTIDFQCYASATVRRSFEDRDYLARSFKIRQRTDDIFPIVNVSYRHGAPEASEGFAAAPFTLEVSNPGVKVAHQRESRMDAKVYYDHNHPAARRLAAALLKLATASPRIVSFSTASKAVDLKVGDLIEISRESAFDPSGRLDALKCRISMLKHNYFAGVSQCEAVEYIPLV